MSSRGREHCGEVRLAVCCGLPGLKEEALHASRAEDHYPSASALADVSAGVRHTLGDMDGLAGGQLHRCPIEIHLKVAFDDVNCLGLVGVTMSGQRPARRRVVNEQAERAGGVLASKVDLGANATRHPHDTRAVCHTPTIPMP